ncbi:MAG TPA: hypothetical protein VHD36_11570 [Pirellulales bacterium]|nr:hypothetical protein [Pirellulales bacterium]
MDARRSSALSLRRIIALLLLAAAVTTIVAIRHFVIGGRVSGGNAGSQSEQDHARHRRPTARESFAALLANEQPRRLLRMVAYDPTTQAQLSIAQLKSLGKPGQQFTFVGDYDELRGCTVAEAIYKLGGNLDPGQHVSVIIFPAGERPLFAASARGLLQVIARVEKFLEDAARGPNFLPANLDERLSEPARAALDDTSPTAGTWKSYQRFYHEYATAVAEIRAARCSVLDHIGSIDADWHPLGYAQAIGAPYGDAPTLALDLDGKSLPVPDFGARVFLVANAALAELTGQCLLDITDPGRERLPDLDPAVD